MAPVLRSFGVTEFAASGQRYGGYNDAIQTARGDHVPIVCTRAGTVWRTDDGVTLTCIGPRCRSSLATTRSTITPSLSYCSTRLPHAGHRRMGCCIRTKGGPYLPSSEKISMGIVRVGI